VIKNFRTAWLKQDTDRFEPEITQAKLLWDRDYLYVWAKLIDQDIQATITQRDAQTWSDDCFELFLKPSNEHPGYYEFHVTPANTQMDLYIPERIPKAYNVYKSMHEFDFQSAAAVDGTIEDRTDTDRSWQVEYKIAWKDFYRTGGKPAEGELWRYSLCRYDYDRSEDQPKLTSISPLTQPSFHRHEEFAEIRFLGPSFKRTAMTTSKVHGSPEPPTPFTTEPVGLGFPIDHPIHLRAEPNSSYVWMITQKDPYGPSELFRFNTNRIESEKPLSIKQEIHSAQSDRVHYDLCFHPEYPKKPFVFVGLNESLDGVKHSRILRLEVAASDESIQVLAQRTILQWPSDGHNGAAVTFGLDGMLYITSGDGTTDSDTNLRGQDLTHLTAKVLRIDVRNSTEEKPYEIPGDNPFLHRANARPETWAYGLRNPWRITTDTESGRIWLAQNGQDVWEQVYLVKRGANYGWSVMEGSSVFYANREPGPEPFELPVMDHHHSQARSLTGGIVYRGTHPEHEQLRGEYIYGDYSTGKIWAISHDGDKPSRAVEIADTPHAITGFASMNHGEIWIADHLGKSIVRLVPNRAEDTSGRFPRLLSQTGLFTDVAKHRYAEGIVPYSVNSPLWSDGAHKERAFAIPEDSSRDHRIEFQNQFGWTFPNGTVLIKSFALEKQAGRPESRRWIETRLMLRQQNEWVGYSYRWNEQGTDAELVDPAGADVDYAIEDQSLAHGSRVQRWHYPSRAECMVCHSRAANYTLGLQTSQINRAYSLAGNSDNQLLAFEKMGLFKVNPQQFAYSPPPKTRGSHEDNPTVDAIAIAAAKLPQRSTPSDSSVLPALPAALPKLSNPYDENQPLEARVQAYLHSNCASCHVPAGGGNAAMELSHPTPWSKMGIIDAEPKHHDLGISGARLIAPGDPDKSLLLARISRRGKDQMPPVASNEVDSQAVALIRLWIESLARTPE
jgi:glucose/arabinose dehydrogenase